jgi:glutathione-regulated potassium-efflux system ancillary protein KefF
VLHGAHRAGDAELAAHAKTYAQKLADYPAWPEIAEVEDCVDCQVPESARPVDRSMEPA